MLRQESKFSIQFRHWLMENPQFTCAYEIKHTRGKKAFPLREWKEEQRNFAESIQYSKKGVLVRTENVRGLPDYIYLKQAPVFVVISFPEGFAIISADNLKFYKGKSINFEQSSEIAYITKTT